ncbi:hypothetical protein [Psychrobacter sp. DM4]|uniref:hypothetical protein n=1 Tax=Psychrobacter sp. DM4 TaxID=3440637 RepID=UPI003F4FBCB6
MDKQEKSINEQFKEINPTDEAPDSLAEATTAPLDDNELGKHATEDDVKKNDDK